MFGSDVFDGDMAEFDRALERYHRMLDECAVPAEAQQNNIFAGTTVAHIKPQVKPAESAQRDDFNGPNA